MFPVRVPHDQRSPRSGGFTLIELLVVIFIIGILIASVLTVVPKVKRAVYAAETQAQLSAISNAIQQYYNDFKSYPGPLPNSQLNTNGDSSGAGAYIVSGNSGNTLPLGNTAPVGFTNSNYVPSNMNSNGRALITSSQNLVLGLLGGLEYVSSGDTFVYNPQDIFSDGQTPAPRGPASLNAANPRRQQSYIQVKAGEISIPSLAYNGGSGGSFQDEALRSPLDAMIPVFLDKYADPLPILYYRTNVGGSAIVGDRKSGVYCDDTGTTLTNPLGSTIPPAAALTPQYDLMQNMPYVKSKIGTIGSNPNSYHGLQGITNTSNSTSEFLISSSTPATPPVDSIDTTTSGQNTPTNNGANGLAYFKDPTLNSTTYDGTAAAPTNVNLGVARQKDGFVLISAGPDRLYGTHDDLIFPGPLQP